MKTNQENDDAQNNNDNDRSSKAIDDTYTAHDSFVSCLYSTAAVCSTVDAPFLVLIDVFSIHYVISCRNVIFFAREHHEYDVVCVIFLSSSCTLSAVTVHDAWQYNSNIIHFHSD
jgi:hypothetical protein